MSVQSEKKFIQDLEDAINKASRNNTCLFPGCSGKPIGSHIIARKTLKLIADQSHVLIWNPSVRDMERNINAGESVEQLYSEPVRVGIQNIHKVTFPLFCDNHDGPVFAPLENGDSSLNAQQVFLLAYRALCSLTYRQPATEPIFAVSEQYGYQHSLLAHPINYQSLKDIWQEIF